MNLKDFSFITWRGQVRPTCDPQGVLAEFDTVVDGLRAGFKNLINQQKLHNLNTWTEIIRKYAPPEENNTGAYIEAVCKATEVEPYDILDLGNPEFLDLAGRAIIIHEQGFNPCTDEQLSQGVKEALAIPPVGV